MVIHFIRDFIIEINEDEIKSEQKEKDQFASIHQRIEEKYPFYIKRKRLLKKKSDNLLLFGDETGSFNAFYLCLLQNK